MTQPGPGPTIQAVFFIANPYRDSNISGRGFFLRSLALGATVSPRE